MKKLLVLSAAILISCQLIVGQINHRQPEFSVWAKTEFVANIANIHDISHTGIQLGCDDFDLLLVTETKQQKMIPWKITAVSVFAVVSEAIGDALYDKGKQKTNNNEQRQNLIMAGKAFQAASLGSYFLYIPIMRNSDTHWLWVPVVNIGWRITMFDPVYNIARGLPIGQIGNTSHWDKMMQVFSPPTGMQLFGRAVFATFTIAITFDKF